MVKEKLTMIRKKALFKENKEFRVWTNERMNKRTTPMSPTASIDAIQFTHFEATIRESAGDRKITSTKWISCDKKKKNK